MAELVVLGAAVGAPMLAQDLYNYFKDAVSRVVWCKKHCQELEQDLDRLQPICDKICLPDLCEEQKCSLGRFKETLAEGRSLVATCLQRGGWAHPFERYRQSHELHKLQQKILQHLPTLPLLNTLQMQDLRKQADKNLEDLIHALKSEITPLVDWVRPGASGDRNPDDERLGKRRLDEPIQEDGFLVGLDNRVNEVKSLLLSGEEEKMLMIVGGMGGIGKTTLAIAICNDPQVQAFFEGGIHFFTVSQSPDMKALLSSIWEKVVGKPVPLFQNEEDAYRQVKRKLLSMPSKGRLLVLDDVWSKPNLEKLSFEGQGLKTMITTRQAPNLETRQSHTYNLGLLGKENAQSLFCYWAFGEDSIPSWVEEPLVVEEVISECKCLPLALKVIGASLSRVAEFPAAWRNARDKLREATPLGHDHEYALQGRLVTSIDALDPVLRECFLDLGAYPEDSWCSADTLLGVWVYVRGMAWDDAVFALLDLGNRCLLDFDSEVTSADVGRALEYGSAKTLKFSQHDVMRDLALHLGRKDGPPSRRTRLLMPQKGKNIPTDWQLDQAPLAAQLISIRTGAMMEQDWPATLAFPYAEALLLDIADCSDYHLPPFIQSMCKLKVMSMDPCMRLEHLPESFGQLSGLKHLSLARCRALDLPESFGQLSGLEHLSLEWCGALEHLPESFGQLSGLEHLSLEWCGALEHLPESFGQLSGLEHLSLAWCGALEHLPESFGQLSGLKDLILRGCGALEDLPESFGQLSGLEHLSFEECISLEHLPESFGQLSGLKHLSLEGCGILEHLPESFGQLSGLEHLNLEWCEALEHLPESFGQLSGLEHLSLAGCEALEHLPESFGQLSGLKDLSLEGCWTLKHLPESFGQLSGLEHLSLTGCWTLKHLPESFGQLRLEKQGVDDVWKAVRGDIAPQTLHARKKPRLR